MVGLRKAGLPVRGGTALRALIQLTSSTEMFAHAVLLAKAYDRKGGSRETDYVAGHPTVDLPRELVKKLDDVVTDLAEKMISANRRLSCARCCAPRPTRKSWPRPSGNTSRSFPRDRAGWAARKARKRGKS